MKNLITTLIVLLIITYARLGNCTDWDRIDAEQAQTQMPFLMLMQVDQQQRAEQARYEQQQQALRLQQQELELRQREIELQRQIEYQRAKDNEGFFSKLKNALK